MHIKAILRLITIMFLFHATCYSQVRLTLQQAIDSTLNRNLQIKRAKLNVDLTEQNLIQSKNNRLPNLTTSPQASVNWGRTLDVSTYNYITQRVFLVSGSVGTQITLFQGGQLRNQIVQNKLLLEADQSNVSRVRNDLVLATATAFLQVLTSQDLLVAAQQQIQLAKLNVEKVQKGVNAGNKSIADLAQAQALQANTELDEATILNQLEVSWLNIKQLMEMSNIQIALLKPDISKISDIQNIIDTTGLLVQAISENPDIKFANLQRDAAYQGIKVAKSILYPNLSLFASAGSNFSDARSLLAGTQQVGFDTVGTVGGTAQPVISPVFRSTTKNYTFIRQFTDNFYQSAGMTLQIPIFNRFIARTNIRKAKISYQISQVNAQIAVSDFTKVIRQALSDIKTAEKRLLASQSNLNATKRLLNVSEKRYQAGFLNSIDYNTALTNFNKVEFELIQARYDVLFKHQVIKYYLGQSLNL